MRHAVAWEQKIGGKIADANSVTLTRRMRKRLGRATGVDAYICAQASCCCGVDGADRNMNGSVDCQSSSDRCLSASKRLQSADAAAQMDQLDFSDSVGGVGGKHLLISLDRGTPAPAFHARSNQYSCTLRRFSF